MPRLIGGHVKTNSKCVDIKLVPNTDEHVLNSEVINQLLLEEKATISAFMLPFSLDFVINVQCTWILQTYISIE